MSDASDIDAIREQKKQELAGGASGSEAEAEAPAETPAEPVHVRDAAHLEELTSTHDVVLVDYHADWCGPCKMLEPIVAEIARDTDAAVAKVDIDAHQDMATNAGVRGVPTLFLYVGGEAVKQMVGLQDAATLRDLIEQYS